MTPQEIIDKDEIIEMARQVYGTDKWNGGQLKRLEAFAKLVADKERERIANKVDELGDGDPVYTWWVAEQIRARGHKE
jgi:hypothetical protein